MNKYKIQKIELRAFSLIKAILSLIVIMGTYVVAENYFNISFNRIALVLISIAYIIIQDRLTKNLIVEIIDNEMFFNIGKKRTLVKGLKIYTLGIKKIRARIFRYNKEVIAVVPLYQRPFEKISKEQKNFFKVQEESFLEHIEIITKYSKVDKWSVIDMIPILFVFTLRTCIFLAIIAIPLFIIYAIYFIFTL